ncbi:Xaa-Pro peptidase family protein [Treponema primitia]|uniref:M24 family metallopeptidase n=1 Tax=Treponema primitia TaxID=88058 RepID=UPI00397F58D6
MSAYDERRKKLYEWMVNERIAMVMFEDTEGRRDPAIRWMTGQPSDALLFLSAEGKSLLVPWDANMAAVYAQADVVIPYGEFERRSVKALQGAAALFKIPLGSRVEIPPVTSYTNFLKYVGDAGEYDILCRNSGTHGEAESLRAIKDEEEQEIYRKAGGITNEIIDLLENNITAGRIPTEIDVVLFIEAECRKRGCEGTGFETLAAGAGRSFGIHAFPAYTAEPFAGPGLSILDFGLKYRGYTTDVTLSFAKAPLSPAQEKMLSLTEKAYEKALSMVKDGVYTREISLAADAIFGKARKAMPHALGHGIGLEAHEAPYLRSRQDNTWQLRPGMVFTLEPGLYDPVHGGCRLENDILLTESGPELLTKARIIRF